MAACLGIASRATCEQKILIPEYLDPDKKKSLIAEDKALWIYCLLETNDVTVSDDSLLISIPSGDSESNGSNLSLN